ncbi:MAG: multicopper oxidase domain-containing protein, partial [Longispora sp.]|nr:multicopper oxidase domain-containing protein [Longispora sp. (in: high G+C Gram-positive bacteria)]
MPAAFRIGKRTRIIAACVATAVVLGPLTWFWQSSFLPETYSVMDMGYPDWGGGPAADSRTHGEGLVKHSMTTRDVSTLTADPNRPTDVSITLTARKQKFTLPSGRIIDGYTLNGQSPGPAIQAIVGQLVQVKLINESVTDGVALHWHGLDVPNAEDGMAGVTQDAVGVGEEHTYRFVVGQVGTFWYHSHQVSHEQVAGGLLGSLVVTPAAPTSPDVVDTVAVSHLYNGIRTINGQEGDVNIAASPGQRVRVRVINT